MCLLCSKLYTSRYNIRMHLNTHTGRNVHTCPYCSIQFISRQSYEGHMKSHTEDEDDICDEEKGLQIVSVKSIPVFEASSNSSLEEIQIEPDIVQEQSEEKGIFQYITSQPFQKNESSVSMKGCHILPVTAAPTKPTLQIRPLSQMQSMETLKRPSVTFHCSFCNTKHESQEVLLKHLSQHVNFHGSVPSSNDLQKGFMSFNVPSQVQKGVLKTKFMCLSCGKLFGKEPQVKIHMNVHYGDNIYNCRFCEKVFANYSAFEVSFNVQLSLDNVNIYLNF